MRLRWLARTTTVPTWLLGALIAGTIGASTLFGVSIALPRTEAPSQVVETHAAPSTTSPSAVTATAGVAPFNALSGATEPALDVDALRSEIIRLAADLERAQRDSTTLQGLAQQQQQDLVHAQTALQSTSQQREVEVQDLQARIGALEGRIGDIEQLAARLRSMVGLPSEGGPAGGPAGAVDLPDEPAAAARERIAQTEVRLTALQEMLEEIETRARARLASVSVPPSAPLTAAEMAFAPYIPRGRPVLGPITSTFGNRPNPFLAPATGAGEDAPVPTEFHSGIDISVPEGTPVLATGPGMVILAGPYGDYGNLVVIDHGNGIRTYYGHNSQLLVGVGQSVEAGQAIARAGSTGRSTGPHVHYEVRINGNPVDPVPYLQLP